MKMLLTLLAVTVFTAAGQTPTVRNQNQPIISGDVTKVSEHVWAIMGFPNIAIVVGSRATLVVDTGLGPKNGAIIARAASKLAPQNSKLFLTTTHYHPEHAGGEPGFPSSTILIRDDVQQRELETHGQELLDLFRGMSAENKELLAGVTLRTPDLIFDKELSLDLGGGVKARLLWLGGAHTMGDELTLVEPDQTLISGDVVQNNTAPYIYGNDSTPADWAKTLAKVATLNVAHVLPDHSAPGDGSLVAAESELINVIRSQALELKRKEIPVDAAGKQISSDLKFKHPDWRDTNVSDFVKRVYAESSDSK